MTPNGKPETFQTSWIGGTIVANPGRACTNAAQPPPRPRFCTPYTFRTSSFENVTVLHDVKPTFTFSNPRLLLQAAPPPADIRPPEPVHPVVVEFTVVCVREFQPVVPLALPVEKPRHALAYAAAHLFVAQGFGGRVDPSVACVPN